MARSLPLVFSLIERNISVVVATTVVVVLARLLTPAEIGAFSIAYAIINVAQDFSRFGIDLFILQDRELEARRAGGMLALCLIASALILLAILALSFHLGGLFDDPGIGPMMRILALSFLLIPFGATANALLRRHMRFDGLMHVGIGGSLAHGTTAITLAWIGKGGESLAWATLAGIVVNGMIAWRQLKGIALPRPVWRWDGALIRFGGLAGLGACLGDLLQRLPELMIGRGLGSAAVGYYSRGNSLITLFNQVAMDALWPVAVSGLAKTHREERPLLDSYVELTACSSAFAWPALATLALLAGPFILLVFGEAWRPAIVVTPPLCLAAMCQHLVGLNRSVLSATGRVGGNLASQSVALVGLAGLLVIATPFGIVAVAWALALGAVFNAGLTLAQIRRQIALPVGRLGPVGLHALAVTGVTLLPLVAWDLVTAQAVEAIGWFGLVGRGLVAILAWGLALVLTRHPLARLGQSLLRPQAS